MSPTRSTAARRAPARTHPHTVAVVLVDGGSAFEFAVAVEVFGLDRREIVDPWYRFLPVAADEPPLRIGGGFTVDTPWRLEHLVEADTVIVPVWPDPAAPVPAHLTDAIRAAYHRGARIVSFCSGAFVLAAAGLLDGRRATTHWKHAARLAALYPAIQVDPGVLYVEDGRIFTSAGTAAGIDVSLHLVRLDHGAEVANAVARRMVVPPHRDGGQAQYVDRPVPSSPDRDDLGGTLAWAAEHLDAPLTVEQLAAHAHLSPRTFARRFRAVTGTTPLQWILAQRVLRAQRLLETTDQPVELIARDCGFGSAAALRLHFQRVSKTSPQAYRRTFHHAAAAG
jgi:AraC family transcriptional regulator, transcriptional activator FtrA